ncbi:putative uncharacterized protein [Pseudomonas sp. StFLB209]|uniref:phage tail protein n=1 Tax=Pseudomonas sp. StFLB209 TaxID=1028989 RepID=UPI0004F68EE6|nr:phage tail protein [Pseudomonas sp. StFLB209]BAP41290.1 putative uncharacterized protein [Pseudomonas sp. StFLB209]
MIKLELPFWLDGAEATKLKAAAQAWWDRAEAWMTWPLLQLDPETCHPQILDLLAWQRDISRFRGEPLSLYRLRVKYAFANAKDAGSTVGFKRIFQRLGIGDVQILERQHNRDWDVVQLLLSDQQLSDYPMLLDLIVNQYGRTCRRYELVGTTHVVLQLDAYDVASDHMTITARFDDTDTVGVALLAHQLDHDHMTLITQ